jgi:hypothetical protein
MVTILCGALLTALQPVHSQTVSAGPNTPSAAFSVASGGGDLPFHSPNNSFTSNNNYTTAVTLLSLFNGRTSNLQATDFGFAIPSTAVITGIEVFIERSADNIGLIWPLEAYVTDNNIQLLRNGTPIGSNLAQSARWTGSDAVATYGGISFNWGVSNWTPADINASNFGISVSANVQGLIGLFPIVKIDNIRITVHYLEDALLTGQPKHNDPKLLPKQDKEAPNCYPNPFVSNIQLKGIDAHEAIHLSDAYGNSMNIQPQYLGNKEVQLNGSHLQPGLYFLHAGGKTWKILKK